MAPFGPGPVLARSGPGAPDPRSSSAAADSDSERVRSRRCGPFLCRSPPALPHPQLAAVLRLLSCQALGRAAQAMASESKSCGGPQ